MEVLPVGSEKGANDAPAHELNELQLLLVQMKHFLKESEIRSQNNKKEVERIRQELAETRRQLALLL